MKTLALVCLAMATIAADRLHDGAHARARAVSGAGPGAPASERAGVWGGAPPYIEVWRQKLAAIVAEGDHPSKGGRRTVVTQTDLNAYLLYDAPAQLPAGVVEPSVTIVGGGRVSARAVVDLDAVRKAKSSSSLLDPTSYLTGRLPVTASGLLKTANGRAQLILESSTVGGVPVPKLLLQEIVSYYTKTADKPSGIGLDDPFALPARIREIQVERGQAIIVQ